ncbi:MAG: CoA-binding protein [Dehalococcoidia bacterium]
MHDLETIFHPRSIALVGVSRKTGSGRTGPDFLSGLTRRGFQDEHALYLVNPGATEIAGLPCFPSLLDCPGPVDHVISLVPAAVAPTLVDHCAEKGVHSVHFFTAGFAESGEEAHAEAERELMRKTREAGLRVIGPNCLGMYVPSERISFNPDFPEEPGPMFVLSQSGGNAMSIIAGLGRRGVRCSKGVSFGNGRDIDAPKLLEYAAGDPESELVVAYLEGAGDGRALFEALKRCAPKKPTVILKGGLSAGGAAAASSHTASLAGSAEMFDALCRQTGAMMVETLEELEDLVVALCTGTRTVRGSEAKMLVTGGGYSVLAADAVARRGITLPALTEPTRRTLRERIPVAGNSIRNPIDYSFVADREDAAGPIAEIVALAPEGDMLLMTTPFRSRTGRPGSRDGDDAGPEEQEGITEAEKETLELLARLQGESERPVIVVDRSWTPMGGASSPPALLQAALEKGIGIYPSMERAARAVELLLTWRRRRAGLPEII